MPSSTLHCQSHIDLSFHSLDELHKHKLALDSLVRILSKSREANMASQSSEFASSHDFSTKDNFSCEVFFVIFAFFAKDQTVGQRPTLFLARIFELSTIVQFISNIQQKHFFEYTDVFEQLIIFNDLHENPQNSYRQNSRFALNLAYHYPTHQIALQFRQTMSQACAEQGNFLAGLADQG